MLLLILLSIVGGLWILGHKIKQYFNNEMTVSQINVLISQRKELLLNETDPLVIQQLNTELGVLMAKSTILSSRRF